MNTNGVLETPRVEVGLGGTGTLQIFGGATVRGLNGGNVQINVNPNGTLQGAGGGAQNKNVKGNVNNKGGTIKPGNSPGIFAIDGNYTQESSGILEIEIAGTNNLDLLDVTGTATLQSNSVFNFSFLNGFSPQLGDRFTFLTASQLSLPSPLSEFDPKTCAEVGFTCNFANLPSGLDMRLISFSGGNGYNLALTAVPEPLTILGTGVVLGAIPVLKKEYLKRKKQLNHKN